MRLPNRSKPAGAGFRFWPGLATALAMCLLGVPMYCARAQVESSAFQIIQFEASARTAAMGGSSTALAGINTSNLFANPALIDPGADGRLEVSYLNHLADLNAGWISWGHTVDSVGTFVAGLRYLSFGEFDEADELGNRIGTFSANDLAFSVGLSRTVRDLFRAGLSIQFLHESLAGQGASAMTVDAGLYRAFPQSTATVGLSVQNLGVVLSSIGEHKDRLPVDLRLGATKQLAHLPLLVSVTGVRLNDLDGGPEGSAALTNLMVHVLLGVEFRFGESVQIRFGYNHQRHDELKIRSRLDLAGFSTGFGLQIRRVGIDYAFNSWSSLGGLHRFTIQTKL